MPSTAHPPAPEVVPADRVEQLTLFPLSADRGVDEAASGAEGSARAAGTTSEPLPTIGDSHG